MLFKFISIRALLFVIFLIHNGVSYAQTLPINRLINDVYPFEDTINYVVDYGIPFFTNDSLKRKVEFKIFKNEQAFINTLQQDYIKLLSISIVKVDKGSMVLHISLNFANRESYIGKPKIFGFYDERLVECIQSKSGEWVYSKTLGYKGHITDNEFIKVN